MILEHRRSECILPNLRAYAAEEIYCDILIRYNDDYFSNRAGSELKTISGLRFLFQYEFCISVFFDISLLFTSATIHPAIAYLGLAAGFSSVFTV